MKTIVIAMILAINASAATAANPRVLLETTKGNITIELYPEKAPETVDNFIIYVRTGHYDGTIFHRVIPGFMIQGGGYTPDMNLKDPREPIQNEATNGLKNERGTVAMARTSDPHSATAQFFINVVDNPSLNFQSKQNGRTWGYAVFGRVVDGMDVVDKIRHVKTHAAAGHQDVPVEPVVIEDARMVETEETQKPA